MDTAIAWGRKAGTVTYDDLEIMLNGLCANHLAGDMEAADRLSTRMKQAFPETGRDDILGLDPHMIEKFGPVITTVLDAHGFH